MTQKDAFEFLELPESSSRSQIKIRLVEKLEDFSYLSEHASSDFLRRIHAKNIEKVRKIQDDFFPWSKLESGSEVVLPMEDEKDIDVDEPEIIHTTPIIVAAGSKGKSPVPEKNDPAAWLISHTENKEAKAYPLKTGKNYIGRKAQQELIPFIVLEADPYVSRVHAVIMLDASSEKNCVVMDSIESNNGQPSKNGTYVNGDKNRVTQHRAVAENDTIQIGNTKLVLKYHDRDLKEIIAEVEKGNYLPTVVFE